ncbi:MAG: hydrogen gas-evolving membrane-bound hydrogenase subunit E [Chloroflexota bacterium]
MKRFITGFAILLLTGGLIYTVSLLPPMGEAVSPTRLNTIPRYLEHGVEEAGAENIITGIILNYRGYDTMGEVTVIFSALAAVLAVLGREKKSYPRHSVSVSPTVATITTARFLVPFIILFSVYTILHGDVSPGGGFQGGAIIGASLVLFTTIFGFETAQSKIPRRLRVLLEGSAVIAFIFCGLLGLFAGTNFLTYILPGVPVTLQPVVRTVMLLLIEIGIGTGGAMIFTSIIFALLKEE